MRFNLPAIYGLSRWPPCNNPWHEDEQPNDPRNDGCSQHCSGSKVLYLPRYGMMFTCHEINHFLNRSVRNFKRKHKPHRQQQASPFHHGKLKHQPKHRNYYSNGNLHFEIWLAPESKRDTLACEGETCDESFHTIGV